MYKVMLIDDDVPMLKFLRQLIDWDQLGVKLVGDTYSATKALKMFQEQMPDIVITDIGLPQMNGLELAAHFRSIKPEIRLIFLTCHQDFDYAKQAINLNADSYLIKYELTVDRLTESLTKALNQLQTTNLNKERDSYVEVLHRNLDLLKKSFFKQVAKGEAPETLLAFANRLGIQWDKPSFMVGVCYVMYSSVITKYECEDFSLIEYCVYNIADELTKEYAGISVFHEKGFLAVIFNYQSSLKLGERQYMRTYMQEVQQKCRQFLGVEIGVICGPNKQALLEIGGAFRQMDNILSAMYYLDPKTVDWNTVSQNEYSPAASLFDKIKVELMEAVNQADMKIIEEQLQHLLDTAKSFRVEPSEFVNICTGILRMIELQQSKSSTLESFYASFLDTIHAVDTVGLMRWKLEQFVVATKMASETRTNEPKLQVIDQYIKQNLTETITSVDVANHLFLSPSYFSRYFKKLTGENFTDYVHSYKIKLASKMLPNSDDSIEQVALKLGYSDRTYFSKVFKKYFGVTPGEFKSKLGKE